MLARSALLLAAGAAAAPVTSQGFNLYVGSGGNPAPAPLTTASLSSGGVFPSLSNTASTGPVRSECGHGAMMAWADKLWVRAGRRGVGEEGAAAVCARVVWAWAWVCVASSSCVG